MTVYTQAASCAEPSPTSMRLQLEEIDAITIAMEKLNVTRSITEAAGKLGYHVLSNYN